MTKSSAPAHVTLRHNNLLTPNLRSEGSTKHLNLLNVQMYREAAQGVFLGLPGVDDRLLRWG